MLMLPKNKLSTKIAENIKQRYHFQIPLFLYELFVKFYKCIAFVLTSGYNTINKISYAKEKCVMATKSANLYARIEPDVKEQAESILAALGIPASNAINMFYKQIILQNGLPFDVKLPVRKPLAMGALSKEELGAEIEKGYADMLAGRTEHAEKVFADIRKELNL